MIVAIVSSSDRACSLTAFTSSSSVTFLAIGPTLLVMDHRKFDATDDPQRRRRPSRGRSRFFAESRDAVAGIGASRVNTHRDAGANPIKRRCGRPPGSSRASGAARRGPGARARSGPGTAATPAADFPVPRTPARETTSRRTPSGAGERGPASRSPSAPPGRARTRSAPPRRLSGPRARRGSPPRRRPACRRPASARRPPAPRRGRPDHRTRPRAREHPSVARRRGSFAAAPSWRRRARRAAPPRPERRAATGRPPPAPRAPPWQCRASPLIGRRHTRRPSTTVVSLERADGPGGAIAHLRAAHQRRHREPSLPSLDDLQPEFPRARDGEAARRAGRLHGRGARLLPLLDPVGQRPNGREDLRDEEAAVAALAREELDELVRPTRSLEGLAVLVLVLGDHEPVVERVHGDHLGARPPARLVEATHVPH